MKELNGYCRTDDQPFKVLYLSIRAPNVELKLTVCKFTAFGRVNAH